MQTWLTSIFLKDVFFNVDMSFQERREAVVDRIRNSQAYEDYDPDLFDFTEELADAPDVESFDTVWAELLQVFKRLGIWVETR